MYDYRNHRDWRNIMADADKIANQKANNRQRSMHIIRLDTEFARKWFQIICLELPIYALAFYILVQILFFKIFKCHESENVGYCQCLQFTMSEEVSFLGKIKLIVINPSTEEMGQYISLKNSTKCHLQNLNIIKSMQDYETKTKEVFEKTINGIGNYGEKAKDSIKDIFNND